MSPGKVREVDDWYFLTPSTPPKPSLLPAGYVHEANLAPVPPDHLLERHPGVNSDCPSGAASMCPASFIEDEFDKVLRTKLSSPLLSTSSEAAKVAATS